MTAKKEIANHLEAWRQLTQAEAAAIQRGLWPVLRKVQAVKASLQKLLNEARAKWDTKIAGGALEPSVQKPLRQAIAKLVSMEGRNAHLLTVKLRVAEARRKSLDEAARNLRKVQASYASKPDGKWRRYS